MLQFQGVFYRKELRCVCGDPIYWDDENEIFTYTCTKTPCSIHPDDIPDAMELTGNYSQNEIQTAKEIGWDGEDPDELHKDVC